MRFTTSHEWVTLTGRIATVGLTDFAQKELGEVVYIQLPKLNQQLTIGDEAAILESTKAAADTYAPLSGKVIAINDALLKSPSLINTSPEDKGWLFKLELTNAKEYDTLLTLDAYLALVSS